MCGVPTESVPKLCFKLPLSALSSSSSSSSSVFNSLLFFLLSIMIPVEPSKQNITAATSSRNHIQRSFHSPTHLAAASIILLSLFSTDNFVPQLLS
ncbi:hypothetical protein Ahy_B03g067323 isoform C [Arachis hypogaea]|uniref:Uncharacterized protein n=1 Tax=Arachis hypogaea TaxID=3818 RepID=A0A445A6G7_ARAHY|nr:hypothetical protein Ahy_B03g067323 isoform C [Arachis hypogaea]